MNIAQHLVLSLVMTFGTLAQAQEQTAPSAAPPAAPAETQEEIPAPQKSLLKTAATREFNKPLYFDQLDNGVILPPLELEYDLSAANGKVLRIGNVLFSEKNFFFALLPLGKTHSQLNQVLSSGEAEKFALVMAWPDKLMTHGTLEMISRTGTVLWTYSFSQDDHVRWQKQLDEWRKGLITRGAAAKDVARSGIFGSAYAITDVKSTNAPFWGQKDSFRFCITQTDGRNQTKMCSQRYGTKSSGNNVIMGKVRQDPTTPRVLVQNEEAALKNSVPVAVDMPTAFFAELGTGESYEFVTVPNKLELMDISDTKKPGVLRIVGYDTRPLGRSIILNPDQYSSLTKMLGFEATIGDPRKFWASVIKKDDPKIYLPGQGGGVFKQKFELSEIPRAQSRVYLSRRTPTGTYIDGIKLEGRKQPLANISSEQNAVETNERDPAAFVWHFKATERGQINRSYLNVEFEGKTYKSYFELYKGYPRELSGRFTGVQASSDFVIMGELAYNQWFEDLFGWTNYWLSRQRWGVSFKYFQSFNQLKVDTAGNTAPLSVMTLDFKYRATPGLWGRDESVGGMVSYQNVTFDELKAPMLGVGAFWARSMPKVFDDFFNLLPIFRYPKWVDMEFIYYVSSMDSKVKLDAPMSLNFHGKVLWTDRYFGEAGFGMKRYSFTDTSLNQKAELNTFYGTVGLGINF
ncbi:hypothetical protein QJS83_07810 [Bdellovibrio sp. 22V]|uniref:hypothetical protein n=1 Tax=Bdellovibrio sp. 22V TaxID=3044166 RepID=UPI002543DBA2|nr:hypothetical protein [Bdellovibrio sp. 22V]WII73780.1 hypothetical protein QJS83_07810 [Bdellovibrio sp. 22V]